MTQSGELHGNASADDFADLTAAARTLPPGRWAVGVSGGADSVALLRLLHQFQPDLALHVVHLDHETRGEESTADARFVAELSQQLGLPFSSATRSEMEAELSTILPNPSEHYRVLRHALFQRVIERNGLEGVALAHHEDDVAETVFQRLIRGSGMMGLTGISDRATIGSLVIHRPLLAARRDRLRAYLRQIGQPWREDASNESDAYLRNRLRRILAKQPGLKGDLRSLAATCRAARDWISENAKTPGEIALAIDFEGPAILSREAARRWLLARGVPQREMSPAVIDRLLLMASDAATPAKQQFPGNVTIRRQKGRLRCEPEG